MKKKTLIKLVLSPSFILILSGCTLLNFSKTSEEENHSNVSSEETSESSSNTSSSNNNSNSSDSSSSESLSEDIPPIDFSLQIEPNKIPKPMNNKDVTIDNKIHSIILKLNIDESIIPPTKKNKIA